MIALRRFVIAVVAAVALLAGAVAPSNAQPEGLWDPLLPMRPSAGAPGDPLAIAARAHLKEV